MSMVNKMKKIFFKTLLTGALISLFSCNVGLGRAVDVKAPTVNLTSPERSGYILKSFTINGVADDDTELTKLTLSVEPLDNPTPENTLSFRFENAGWEKYDAASDTWSSYENEFSTITGSKTHKDWTLGIVFDDTVQTGTEFNIITQVYDAYKNESIESKDERSVVVDMNEPVVTIISPIVRSYAQESSAFQNDYGLRDNSVLDNLMNGTFTIKGSQKEDGRLQYLNVYLDEKTTTTIDEETLKNDAVFFKKVTGDNLRNWSTDVNLSTLSGYEHNGKLLRLVTESYDEAGNKELRVQGWFTYWNDADIPWITATFGGNTYSENVGVYPSCDLQGQTYDDDGIKSIKITLYRENETTPCKDPTILNLDDTPKYKAWSIKALGETCEFRVEIEAEDVNGNKAAKVTRYMCVTDTNPPSFEIETDPYTPMFGDANGDVYFKGYVEDDGEVKSLKVVRIKQSADATSLIEYYKDSYSEWAKVNATTTSVTDKNGNKIWYIPLTAADPDDAKHRRTFNKKFNIFTDFGINGTTEKLNTQQFIIMVTDNGNCSKIDSWTWAGDSDAPTLSIGRVTVYSSYTSATNNTVKEYIDYAEWEAQNKAKKLQPFNKSGTAITDYITLSGTWSDNSTDIWSNKAKHNELVLTLEESVPEGIHVTVNTNGTWVSDAFVPKDVTTEKIHAEFSDYAGNVVKADESFFVNSSKPQLLRITSSEKDGSYKAGAKELIITMEFNKAVAFFNGSPTLTLNVPTGATSSNRKKISCKQTAGTYQSTFEFGYTPAAGEDVAALDVESINTNGITWKDQDGTVVENVTVPLNVNDTLAGSRSICIDTVAPQFSTVSAISAQKSYKAGESIYIQATFNEDVIISDVSKIKLNLNAASNLTTNTVRKTGARTLMFTYQIADGQNASPLKINSITITGAGITDVAGNALVTTPGNLTLTGIVIDTEVPPAPTINNIQDNTFVYNNDGVTFSLGNVVSDASVQLYSIDNGASWTDYTGPVTLRTNGEYIITAKVQDAAGNESPLAVSKRLVIDGTELFNSVTAGVPTGIYTTGKVIPIYLNFKKNVKVSAGSYLTLNNGKTAVISNANTSTNKLIYNYTVAEGDASNGLDVTAIVGTFTDSNNIDVTARVVIPDGKNLIDGRTIKVVTGKPVINSVVLNGNILNITFSSDVVKGDGSVTLTQSSGYKAPCVLSKKDFGSYKLTSADLASYYSLGTNGSDADGNADTTEKYILNYNTDSTNTTLIQLLQAAKADKVSVDVRSSYVSVNNNVVSVELADSYAPPVKGATYTVQIDSNFVKDKQNHSNDSSNGYSVTVSGIENPVIRVNKKRETFNKNNGKYTGVTQPTTTNAKIDCQTPGVTLSTTLASQTNSTQNIGSISKKTINLGNSQNKGTATTIELGTTNTSNGYIYRIATTATKNGTSVTSYEYAYRSVLILSSGGSNNEGNASALTSFWVRGGNVPSGTNTISTFPISWETSDFDKVRAMTEDSSSRYWISWEINVTAYYMVLRGTPVANWPDDVETNGPMMWCWGMQGNAPSVKNTPLYPGQSVTYNGTYDGGAGTLKFYNKHREDRNNGTVNKEYAIQ